ncbi:MAG: LamG-like jellyroll fold domain-containing protein, partial [Desulfobacteria bacterium]
MQKHIVKLMLIGGFVLSCLPSAMAEQSHPFLICTEDGENPNFETLQARASHPHSPWRKMKEKAEAAVDGMLLDDIRIYSRALSTEEINDLKDDCQALSSDPNLELYWKLDETGDANTASDSSGENDGQVNGIAQWVAGKYAGAIRLWGSNDYVQATDYAGVTGSTSRTLTAWIKTAWFKTNPGDKRPLFSWGTKTTGSAWNVALRKLDEQQTVLFLGVVGGNVYGSVNLGDGQWHHIAIVLDEAPPPSVTTTNDITFYVDGNPDNQQIITTEEIDTGTDSDVQAGNFDVFETSGFLTIRKNLSSAALCYVLNENYRPDCILAIKSEIGLLGDFNELEEIGITTWDGSKWVNDYGSHSTAGRALFNAVLALDIIHNGLDPNEVDALEGILGAIITTVTLDNGTNPPIEDVPRITTWRWKLNGYGVNGIWALYEGDTTNFNIFKGGYDNELDEIQISESGVSRVGPVYGWYRMSSSHDSKAFFMDVLEFTGNGSYYDNQKLINFFEWLYGYAVTPGRHYQTFADTDAARSIMYSSSDISASIFRAYRFSDNAAQYAAWCNGAKEPPGELLHYVLMEQELPEPVIATSRVFSDGGAFFRENSDSEF